MPLSANEYRFGLGKREASLLAVLAEGHKAVFSVEDAKSIAGSDAGEVVRRLVRKKWVLALKRGLYAVVPLDVGVRAADAFVVHNFVIASLLVKPYYIGYWSALNHHGLTEQIPRTTFLATTKAKHSIEILNAEYRFVTLTARKFFGWEEVQVEGRPITLSDPEKTIADCLDHPEHCGASSRLPGLCTSRTRRHKLRRWWPTPAGWGTGPSLSAWVSSLRPRGCCPDTSKHWRGSCLLWVFRA